MANLKSSIKSLLPESLILAYHYLVALLAVIYYGFPSKKIKVVAITGTKGKSTVAEYTSAILEKAGYKVALSSTIHFKIGHEVVPNKYKMTMPGRFFMQRFLSKAVKANCDWAVIEMTSEGVKQFRHKFIELDALLFKNISPEHIESHGSFENYLKAKLKIGKALEKSKKRPRILVANADSEHSNEFLKLQVEYSIPISLSQGMPVKEYAYGIEFDLEGTRVLLKQKGRFSVQNALLAAAFAKVLNIKTSTIKAALEGVKIVPGRMEHIEEGQDFEVVVDYAHTPDSLEKLYKEAFGDKRKICVLGNTGGGRDKWKRQVMAQIASKYCEKVILTDEDPYDEDPMQILKDMEKGADPQKTKIVLDRRQAIRQAIKLAVAGIGDTVLITGKGTDPYIMRANGEREPWSDAKVAHEELRYVLGIN